MTNEKAWSRISANVNINLKDVVITYKTTTRILQSIIEFLSYNRNQIPLVYETFNHMAQNLENSAIENNSTNISVKNIAIERQRSLAIQTNHKFQDISSVSNYDDFIFQTFY